MIAERSAVKRTIVEYLSKVSGTVHVVVAVDVDGVGLPEELINALHAHADEQHATDPRRLAVTLILQEAMTLDDNGISVPMAFSEYNIDRYQCRIPWIAVVALMHDLERHEWRTADAPNNRVSASEDRTLN